MKGAFQTSREIFENPIWNDVPKFRLFFYIVGNAVFSHDGIKKADIHIQRGQYLRSYRNLRDDLEYIENRSIKKYSLSLIKRKVEQLVKEERLKVEDTELGTLFTVVNYAWYQGLDNYKTNNENAERTNAEQLENSNGTQREQTQNNNKNVKNVKNVKNDKNEKERIPYADIVGRLNEKANKNFKHTTRATKECISARWNEGFKLEDFYAVIDYCSKKWSGETFSNGQKGDDYLRPSTLFNGKFDERLDWTTKKENEPSKPKKSAAQLKQQRMMEERRKQM